MAENYYNKNSFHAEGNLVRDPETRFTQTGKAITTFTIAISNGRSACFMDCKKWGESRMLEGLHKGMKVEIVGRMETESWEGQNGKRSKTVCNVSLLGVTGQSRQNGTSGEYGTTMGANSTNGAIPNSVADADVPTMPPPPTFDNGGDDVPF